MRLYILLPTDLGRGKLLAQPCSVVSDASFGLFSVMNASALDLRGFDIAPDSPTSVRNLHLDLDEFDDASQLHHAFCRQISTVEFEEEGISETEKALQVMPASMHYV